MSKTTKKWCYTIFLGGNVRFFRELAYLCNEIALLEQWKIPQSIIQSKLDELFTENWTTLAVSKLEGIELPLNEDSTNWMFSQYIDRKTRISA